MAARARGFPIPVSDLATDILGPVLKKRAGMTIGLVQSWDEIVGERLSSLTRPERIVWPRRMHEDDPFEPATLVIACSGAAALRLQHETAELISRVNVFLGYGAIGRIRIVQKAVEAPHREKPKKRPLTPQEAGRIAKVTGAIEDEGLRAALERLGASVFQSGGKR